MKAITPAAPVAVELIDGQPTTTSLDVAGHFGKPHKDVLARIRKLDCSPQFYERNFSPIQIDVDLGMGRSRKDPAFRMTRDGFTFLCMGFTGKEAAKWKEAYINAFNQLERAVQQQPAAAAAHQVRFDRRPLRGRHVRIALFDGQPWFAAGQLCSALELGSSDRIVRSLPEAHKRKLQQGARELWLVDAVGARRAGDYCQRPVLDEFQPWLDRLLNEFAPEQAQLPLAGASREQMARGLLVAARFMCWFDPQGRMTLKELDSDVAVLKQSEFAGYIADPAGMPAAALPDILAAVSSRIKGLH